jgi:hypothetical protein
MVHPMTPILARMVAAGVGLSALALAPAAGCGDGSAQRASQPTPRPALPSLRLVAMTDLRGYLEPCGCQSRPLGGIDKAAARLRELAADAVPTLLLASGNLFFDAHSSLSTDTLHGAPQPEGDENAQPRWQAETLARALRELSLVAATPGPDDIGQGTKTLQALAKIGGFPWLCGGVEAPADPPLCQPSLLWTRGDLRIGLWGLSERAAGPDMPSVQEVMAEAKRLTADLRARGAALVIGLLAAEARTARRVASATPGLDFLVEGGLDSSQVVAPERVGGTTLLRAGHQGEGLLVVDVFRVGEGSFADVSDWTRRAARQADANRIAELTERIAQWRLDSKVDRARLAEQEQRLAAMRRALEQPSKAPRPRGNTFAAHFIQLDPATPSDPGLRALLRAHDQRVNEHNRVAFAKLRPKPVAPGMAGYLGSERCQTCHAAAFDWWTHHPHGRAYATLERVDKQFSLSCVRCHVTGYGEPGGATIVHNRGLTNVGCESCHGPGSLHAENAAAVSSKNVQRAPSESLCRSCHDPEHSDQFEYQAYRARLLVPGHGGTKPGVTP